jgi:Flp pilus assembly protein TadD
MMELRLDPKIKIQVMKGRDFLIIGIRIFGAVTATVLISACATQSPHLQSLPPLDKQPHLEIADVDLLGVSAEMRQFIKQHVPDGMPRRRRAFALTYATLDPYLLNFTYDPSITLPAADTFREKTGNCLAFSNMFIAMARVTGLQAWYQTVEIPPQWSNVNETFLVSMHVNAVVQDRYSEYVVDVSRLKQSSQGKIRRISDQEAKAQYYNNLGADALVENQLSKAYAYFVKSLQTKRDLAFVWSNLGVVYKRNEQLSDAKMAYGTALELDHGLSTALNNLYVVLVEEGDWLAAEAVQRRVERHRRKNPYYLHHLSIEALSEQRYTDAIELLYRAINLNEEEYRFHFTLARSLFLNGENDIALNSLDRAKQLAPQDAELDTITLAELNNIPGI